MPKMTFAIPCYNMEPWLPVCIESCLRQTEPDIEVLVVDDGSTDGSAAIADHYAAGDARVRVIHQDNQGHGKARQVAQDNATGEFVLFLDADDFIDKNTVRDMVGVAERDGVDAVCGNAVVFSDKTFNSRKYFYHPPASGLTFDDPRYWRSKVAWRWIIRRDVLVRHALKHPPYKSGQDFCFMLEVLTRIDGFSQCGSFFYFFRQEHKPNHMSLDTLINHQFASFRTAKDILLDAGRVKPVIKFLQEMYFRDTRKIAVRLPDEGAQWGIKWLDVSLRIFKGLKPEYFTAEYLRPEVKCDRDFVPLALALCRQDKQAALSLLNSYTPAPNAIGHIMASDKERSRFHTWRRRLKAQLKPLSLRTRLAQRQLEKLAEDRLRTLRR
ncbi:MAG: glycosyltransferase family 2 protein [Desulfovibrionaceae bacterium]|nr:glycosyltransferase family 2 protein [Desulfovibrionaceae bacterium]